MALAVRVILVLAVCTGAAIYASHQRAHGTVAILTDRLEKNCSSVEHHRRVGGLSIDPPMAGAISGDSLECKGLDGSVDVIAFKTAEARAAALAKVQHDFRDVCLIGSDEAALNSLAGARMSPGFRAWCTGELGGRLYRKTT